MPGEQRPELRVLADREPGESVPHLVRRDLGRYGQKLLELRHRRLGLAELGVGHRAETAIPCDTVGGDAHGIRAQGLRLRQDPSPLLELAGAGVITGLQHQPRGLAHQGREGLRALDSVCDQRVEVHRGLAGPTERAVPHGLVVIAGAP